MLSFDSKYRYPDGFELNAQFETNAWPTVLFGASGSGKSTILRLIAGLLKPTGGTIKFNERILSDEKSFLSPETRRVGMLFQEQHLFPHMSVKKNIEYGQRRRQESPSIQVDDLCKRLGIDNLVDRFPSTLSGGEKQRVALARAIASSPRLLLLDEPLNSVDESLRERIAVHLESLFTVFNIPTIVVSHNSKLVERMAKQVFTIQDGQVVDTRL